MISLIKELTQTLDTSKLVSMLKKTHDKHIDFVGSGGYVYFLVKDNKVVYIGASEKRKRIYQHIHQLKIKKDFDFTYYLLCQNKEHWLIEKMLIRVFKTKYNNCNSTKKAAFSLYL